MTKSKSNYLWLLAFMPVVLGIIGRSGVVAEADAYWGARAGIEFMESHRIITPDVHTWTVAGNEWTPNSWGWNLVLGAAFKAMGHRGFALLVLVGSAVVLVTLIAQSMRRGASVAATAVAGVIGLLGLTVWLSPRAHLATLIATLTALAITNRLLQASSVKRIAAGSAALACLQIVAINVHFGALSIVVVVTAGCAAWLAGEMYRSRRIPEMGVLVQAALPAVAMLLASLVNPLGFDVFAHASYVRSQSTEIIPEWDPGYYSVTGALAMMLGVACAVHAWRKERRFLVGAIAASVVLTFGAVRFAHLAVALLTPELAVMLTALLSKWHSHLRVTLIVMGSAFSLVVLPTAINAFINPGAPSSKEFSIPAVKVLPEGCRAFNNDLDGGLIDLLRPDVKVSTDGRNDLVTKARIQEQQRVWRGKVDGPQWLAGNDVNCVIVSHKKRFRGFLTQITASSAWTPVFQDATHTVFLPK